MKDEKANVRFSIRFNLNDNEHKKAWEKLSTLKSGEKTAYLIDAILNTDRRESNYEMLMSEIKELKNVIQNLKFENVSKEGVEKDKIAKRASKDVLDFMKGL
jgi:hypothetical protein